MPGPGAVLPPSLAARRSGQRLAALGARSAAALRRRSARGRLRGRRRRRVPDQIRADVTDAHSGPPRGRSPTGASTPPTGPSCRPSCSPPAGGKASLVARTARPRARHLRLPRRCRGRGRQHRLDHAAAPTAPRWRSARRRRRWRRRGSCRRRRRGRRRASSRGCAGGHGRGDELTVPFGAPAVLSGRLTRADGAGLAGRELRVVARPSRGALAATAAAVGHHRRARRLRAAAGAGALAADHRQLPGRRRARGRRPALAGAAGPLRGLPAGGAADAEDRPGRAAERPGRAAAAPRSRGAASWSRSSTWRRPPAAGARSWSPAPTTAAASAPTTASATSPARLRSACGRRRCRRSAGPTRPDPHAR